MCHNSICVDFAYLIYLHWELLFHNTSVHHDDLIVSTVVITDIIYDVIINNVYHK